MLLRQIADRNAADGGRVARQTGRSWWSLRYLDGTIVNEWDADPGSPNGHQDWSRLATLGKLRRVQGLRLFVPNGKMAQVEAPSGGDATGRLFQFKDASRDIGVGYGSVSIQRNVRAHVIGAVTGTDGRCVLFAWETLPEPEPPLAPHVPPKPDYGNREQPLWALREQHQNWLAAQNEHDAYLRSRLYTDWQRARQEWQRNRGGRLVGPLEDNVNQMRYIGGQALKAEHLGLSVW
jgi:hypothetical protein